MENYMIRALELAQQGLDAQEVPVGCIFIHDSAIVAESRNTVNETRNPTRHAEINCIDIVLEYCKENNLEQKELFKNVTVYVTVEPCIMCAAALNNLNISEVIYGCPNDRFGGKTVLDVSEHFNKSYNVSGGLLAEEAMSLLKKFYKGANPLAPECKSKKKKK